jgi:hypothetical protein
VQGHPAESDDRSPTASGHPDAGILLNFSPLTKLSFLAIRHAELSRQSGSADRGVRGQCGLYARLRPLQLQDHRSRDTEQLEPLWTRSTGDVKTMLTLLFKKINRKMASFLDNSCGPINIEYPEYLQKIPAFAPGYLQGDGLILDDQLTTDNN